MIVGALQGTHCRESIAFHVPQEHTKRQTEQRIAPSVLSASSWIAMQQPQNQSVSDVHGRPCLLRAVIQCQIASVLEDILETRA